MAIGYRQATLEDAVLLIDIYNASFHDDYLRYGACPGYGLLCWTWIITTISPSAESYVRDIL